MISSFSYLSPIRKAYRKVVESELDNSKLDDSKSQGNSNFQTSQNPQNNSKETQELLDPKRNPNRMSDEERMLFYQDEIKRLRGIKKYFEQYRRHQNGQGYAINALETTLERYQQKLDEIKAKLQNSAQSSTQPFQNP